jgi:hypothetical protein
VIGMARNLFCCFAILLVISTGCSKPAKPLAKTYPVHGRVTDKAGKPVGGGYVQFYPESDSWARTAGEIKSDGTYSLTTMRDKLRSDGALPGPNRVTINTPPPGTAPGQAVTFLMYNLPAPKTVEEKDNQIDLQLK